MGTPTKRICSKAADAGLSDHLWVLSGICALCGQPMSPEEIEQIAQEDIRRVNESRLRSRELEKEKS